MYLRNSLPDQNHQLSPPSQPSLSGRLHPFLAIEGAGAFRHTTAPPSGLEYFLGSLRDLLALVLGDRSEDCILATYRTSICASRFRSSVEIRDVLSTNVVEPGGGRNDRDSSHVSYHASLSRETGTFASRSDVGWGCPVTDRRRSMTDMKGGERTVSSGASYPRQTE